MNEEAIKHPMIASGEKQDKAEKAPLWRSYFPFIAAMAGSAVMLLARVTFGGEHFISDGALMMIALAAYLIAAVFFLTNFYAPFKFAESLGLWAATAGVFLNLSSWLVRWSAAYDRELSIFISEGRTAADMPWLIRYIPFANLYDLSLAFGFGAGVTTLLVMRRPHFRIVAAFSLTLAAIILVLARFIGGDFVDLPPVLDSYWRPLHVGVASLSYGVALVCFAAAVLYLLKDGLKVEKMAIWTSIFSIAVFATVSRFSVFAPTSFGTYTASTFVGELKMSLALRADIPYVGWLLVLAAVLMIGAIAAFASHFSKPEDKASRMIGHGLLRSALVVQAIGIGVLVYQIKTMKDVVAFISTTQYERFAGWLLEQGGIPQAQIIQLNSQLLHEISTKWVSDNASQLHLSLNANPVELSALITAFAGTFFIVLFSLKTEKLREALPSKEVLDSLMYKLAGVAFAGLALLLMTGAIWANESWGRYWGWDAKETGALIAWLTYAGFLHSRIAYGWRGRRSAYFAILAFLFVIFTYLGVSYLLPGLHSYA